MNRIINLYHCATLLIACAFVLPWLTSCGRPVIDLSQFEPGTVTTTSMQQASPAIVTPTVAKRVITATPTHHPPTAPPQPTLMPVDIAATIRSGLARADAAHIFQIEQILEETTKNPGRKPFVSQGKYIGQMNGSDIHILIDEEHGGHSDGGHEYLRIGSMLYDRRPPGHSYIDSDQGYKQPYDERTSRFRLLELPTMLTLYIHDIPFEEFRDNGLVTFDHQSCQRFVGENNVAIAALRSLGMSSLVRVEELEEEASKNIIFNEARVTATICEDGYLHEYTVNVAAQRLNQAADTFTINFRFHLWDFDTPIMLTPPADAIDPP